MTYIINAEEANTVLETSGENTLIAKLIAQAEGIIHAYTNVDTFDNKTVTEERHKYIGVGPYYFKRMPVNSITGINGNAVSLTEGDDYLAENNRIIFANNVSQLTTKSSKWNFITFTYTAGYETIPQNLKTACLLLVSALKTNKNMQGIRSFQQGDLSVVFENNPQQMQEFKIALAPYQRINVFS